MSDQTPTIPLLQKIWFWWGVNVLKMKFIVLHNDGMKVDGRPVIHGVTFSYRKDFADRLVQWLRDQKKTNNKT